ncbi:hypothetical protein E2C01_034678 [Portunus trituberculatus]|uniref:HTH psq-type domain-containing protein n=1 Tax=Portunus trituberculatus TaxID=210409 RepID=A0A5B7F6Z7_PORTR|nr:hypothetical protein [Portunus trituberculatus]
MTPKHPAISPSVAKKTRKSLTLQVKLDIIHRHERGEKTNSIASHHGLTPSTFSTIFKSANSIKKAVYNKYNTSRPNRTYRLVQNSILERVMDRNDLVVTFGKGGFPGPPSLRHDVLNRYSHGLGF